MRPENNTKPHYSVCLICEGKKTENNYYASFVEWCKSSHKTGIYYDIQPLIEEEKEATSRGRKIKKRVLRGGDGQKIEPIPHTPEEILAYFSDKNRCGRKTPFPLQWMKTGVGVLYHAGFDEAWVIYDKDGHPNHADSYKLLMAVRNKKFGTSETKDRRNNLNLIFSSRCFEYYLLQHFRRTYRIFDQCECHEGDTPLDCCTAKAKNGNCNGRICINGYARKHGFWLRSKGPDTFKITVSLWKGILNSWHVKWHSLAKDIETDVFLRGSYLNTYKLSLRILEIIPIEPFTVIVKEFQNTEKQTLSREGNKIVITNCSNQPIGLPLQGIKIYSIPRNIPRYDQKNKAEPKYNKLSTNGESIIPIIEYLRPAMDKCQNRVEIDMEKFLSNSMRLFSVIEWDNKKYFFATVPDCVKSYTEKQLEKFRLAL